MLPLAEFRTHEAEVPSAPGVYQIWGPEGQLLYVGVAGRSGAKGSGGRSGLRDRLDSHVRAGPSRGFADYVLRMVLGITLSHAELTALTQEFILRCSVTWEVTPDYRTAVTREAELRRTAAPLLNAAPLTTSTHA